MKQRNEQGNYKTEQQKSCKKKREKKDEFKNFSLGDIKHTYIHIKGIPEEQRDKGAEKLF